MKKYADIFKALSDETRLTILGLLLSRGELCVCDIEAVLEISQSKASRHLRYLRNAGLTEDRREAVWVHYRIATDASEEASRVLAAVREIAVDAVSEAVAARLDTWLAEKSRRTTTCAELRPVKIDGI